MEFVIGFLGALVAMVLFGGGIVIGWLLNRYVDGNTQKVTAEALTEKQKQRVKEEQEAWNQLHNYSVETAYGMHQQNSTAKE